MEPGQRPGQGSGPGRGKAKVKNSARNKEQSNGSKFGSVPGAGSGNSDSGNRTKNSGNGPRKKLKGQGLSTAYNKKSQRRSMNAQQPLNLNEEVARSGIGSECPNSGLNVIHGNEFVTGNGNGLPIHNNNNCLKNSVGSNSNNSGPTDVTSLSVSVASMNREREKTQSVNTAFTLLRTLIPTEPADRKLSKIETLRLASSYIAHLSSHLLSGTVKPKPPIYLNEDITDSGSGLRLDDQSASPQSRICTFCLSESKKMRIITSGNCSSNNVSRSNRNNPCGGIPSLLAASSRIPGTGPLPGCVPYHNHPNQNQQNSAGLVGPIMPIVPVPISTSHENPGIDDFYEDFHTSIPLGFNSHTNHINHNQHHDNSPHHHYPPHQHQPNNLTIFYS